MYISVHIILCTILNLIKDQYFGQYTPILATYNIITYVYCQGNLRIIYPCTYIYGIGVRIRVHFRTINQLYSVHVPTVKVARLHHDRIISIRTPLYNVSRRN